jgi:hypothetical protein
MCGRWQIRNEKKKKRKETAQEAKRLDGDEVSRSTFSVHFEFVNLEITK